MGGQQSAGKAGAGAPDGDASSSSHGKGRPANNHVQLAVSVLGGVPGATAYHSSVVVNGHEYFFSDGGISSSGDLASHRNPQMPDSKPEVIDMGMSPYTGSQMQAALERYFISGTRIDKKYRQMEKLGALLSGHRLVVIPSVLQLVIPSTARSVRNTHADTSVSSLSAWLEKYGRPNRQAEPQE
eukprot:Skav230078  [mRNA]  locus=scaffold2569:188555:202442:+ [translate_table: standard]